METGMWSENTQMSHPKKQGEIVIQQVFIKHRPNGK